MRRLGPILCLWLAALVVPAAAAPLAHREVLPNGIVLLVAERPTIPIVVARLYTRAGSVYDLPDAGGLANLTADMLTRGTAKHTAPELDRAIEFVGGSLEGDAGRDGATVSLSVLKKDLRLGLDLLAEVVLTPTFPEAELKRRSEEIAANIERSEQDPGTVASRLMAQLLYPGHPYSRPVAGTVESVKKLPRELPSRRDHHRRGGRCDARRGTERAAVQARRLDGAGDSPSRYSFDAGRSARGVAGGPPRADAGHGVAGASGHQAGSPRLLLSRGRQLHPGRRLRVAAVHEGTGGTGARILRVQHPRPRPLRRRLLRGDADAARRCRRGGARDQGGDGPDGPRARLRSRARSRQVVSHRQLSASPRHLEQDGLPPRRGGGEPARPRLARPLQGGRIESDRCRREARGGHLHGSRHVLVRQRQEVGAR